MRDNRCPNCENDIASTVDTAIVHSLQTGRKVDLITCPHCHEELNVDIIVTASLSRAGEAIAF